MIYKTKNRTALLDYLKTLGGKAFTVADLRAHFEAQGRPISTATLYHHVNELVKEGLLRKYIVDEHSAVCYEYIGDDPTDTSFTHFKCQQCGNLYRIKCEKIEEINEHIEKEHSFVVNSTRIVIYGVCAKCRKQGAVIEQPKSLH